MMADLEKHFCLSFGHWWVPVRPNLDEYSRRLLSLTIAIAFDPLVRRSIWLCVAIRDNSKHHFLNAKESDMLVLTRKIGESILIPSQGLTISVGTIKRGRVRLRISAPAETRVIREEVSQREQHEVCPTSGVKDED
jgi:carbon storage regulator CsrA